MKQKKLIWAVAALSILLAACGGKKKSDNIIAQRVEKPKPQAPVRMQENTDERDVEWAGKEYHIAIHRQPSDSLPMVKDETGQQFVDNVFTLSVGHSNGSMFFNRSFTKKSVASYLDEDFRKTGIFEGLVFDRVEGDKLIFAASVGHPQTDEYIPLVITLSQTGKLVIERDKQMDTTPADAAPADEDEL